MNTRTTQCLVALALALFAFIYFYERGEPDTSQRAERAGRVFPDVQSAEVTGLTVSRAGFFIRLDRQTDQWRYVAPVRYPAQSEGIERLLNAILELRQMGSISAQEVLAQTNGLGAFGLNPPEATLEIIERLTNRWELRLGRQPWLGRPEVYAQLVGRDGVLVVNADLVKALPAGGDDWRDRSLLPVAGVEFNRFEVRTRTNSIEVVRNATNRWQMTKPLLTRANTSRLEFLLQLLQMARIERFITDDPRADLEPYGLLPPERELVFGLGTNDVLALQLGRSPTNNPAQVFVRRLSHSNVVLVARSVAEPWLAGFREFCDRRLMVFKPEAVDRLEARADEPFAVEREPAGEWRIVEPFVGSADRVLMVEFLAELAGLEFLEFEKEVVTDFAAYGLTTPRRQYVLRSNLTNAPAGPTNQVLARVDFGNPTGYKFFARRSLENSVVTALMSERLPRAAWQLRDRRIWNVPTNQIAGITIQQQGGTNKLVRLGPVRWAPAPGSTGPANSFSLEEAAHRLGHLRAEVWVARGEDQLARHGFLIADHRVTLELAEGAKPASLTLRFGRKSAAGRLYGAVELPGQPGPVIFECPSGVEDFVERDLTLPGTAPGGRR
jgi:hypothetical protein